MRHKSFLMAAVCMIAAAVPAFAQPAAPGDASRGKQLYAQDGCYQCHGYVGQGGAISGPRLAPMKLQQDGFLGQLRHPSNEMPPYEKALLSDADALDIYAYLRSLPASPDAKSIPILRDLTP